MHFKRFLKPDKDSAKMWHQQARHSTNKVQRRWKRDHQPL